MASDNIGKIVIIGGGIIGCSIAYHLTELGVPCTLIERCAVACAASGKAGGFLARTWCDYGPVGPLARASFDLHKIYGAKFDCDYRAVDTLEIAVDGNGSRSSNLSCAPDWLNKNSVVGAHAIGNVSNTAQVHPAKLTQSFIRSAQKNGCELVIDHVTGVEFSSDDATVIKAVKLSGNKTIPCDTLILAMGPWTNTASQWFEYRLPQIGAQRAHSIVVTPKQPITAHALFLKYNENGEGKDEAYPEVYPRPDGTVYLCGFTDKEPLPESADQVTPDSESIKSLQNVATDISSALEDSKLEVGQACYLPLPTDGTPAIGKVPHYNGKLYIAAGHYCWGILNAPATGKGLAELIVNGRSSIDLSPFDPANFL